MSTGAPAERVVITGRGVVGPGGRGTGGWWQQGGDLRPAAELFAERSQEAEGVGRFDARGFDVSRLAKRWVGAAWDFDAEELSDQGNVRLLDRASSLLIAAAGDALAESGIDAEMRAEREVGLVLGTTFCSAHTIAAFDRRAVSAGPRYASPLDFANTVINAAAGQAAIWFDLRGMNSTVAGESASALEAIAYATRALRAGRADALLVGGVEELSFELLLGLERLELLHTDEAAAPAPWSEQRTGFAPGEGAAVFLLETLASAEARKATVFGEILGTGSAFDPSFAASADAKSFPGSDTGQSPCETGAAAAEASLRAALGAAALSASDVSVHVSGANGSRRGDAAGAQTHTAVFGSRGPIVAPKTTFGESLGAGGAMLLMVAQDLLAGQTPPALPPASVAGLETLGVPASAALTGALLPESPELPESKVQSQRCAAVSTLGWSGHAAAVVLGDAADLR